MKPDLTFSSHALDVMRERELPGEWIERTIESPDSVKPGSDGNMHYVKAIPEHSGRMLRVVINENVQPNRVVTVFFDRRLGRKI